MPRCQRTFRRLPNASKFADEVAWICPWCDDHERYEPVRDPDLIAYTRTAHARGVDDFGAPPDPQRPTTLLLGLSPECVLEPLERRYEVYLRHGSDDLQRRLQIGHEVFHRLCSLGRVFHWSHEMLACLQSVRLLEAHGATDYADRMRTHYRRDATRLSTSDLLAMDLRIPSPADGAALYGRAFVLGEALCEAAGWPALARLARTSTRGQPDIGAWLRGLDPATAAECARRMGGAA